MRGSGPSGTSVKLLAALACLATLAGCSSSGERRAAAVECYGEMPAGYVANFDRVPLTEDGTLPRLRSGGAASGDGASIIVDYEFDRLRVVLAEGIAGTGTEHVEVLAERTVEVDERTYDHNDVVVPEFSATTSDGHEVSAWCITRFVGSSVGTNEPPRPGPAVETES